MERFEFLEGYAVYRVPANTPLTQALELVKTAILFAADNNVHRLMIDGRGIEARIPPSRGERYFILVDWATAASGKVKVSLIANAGLMDPERAIASVASNSRFDVNAFVAEADALAWLLGDK